MRPCHPLRLLCLHGHRQDAQSLRRRTAALRKDLERDGLAKLVFVDGLFAVGDSTTTPGSDDDDDDDGLAGVGVRERGWWKVC